MAADHEREVETVDDVEGAGTFAVAVEGTIPVITVTGEVTIETSPTIAAGVLQVVREQEPAALVFELGGVTFMDSSGLTVLVDAAARCQPVTVRNASEVVRRVIEATGLTDVLRLEP